MRAMVVAPQPLAVRAGLDMLEAGGNAFDAAVATAFAQGLVDPQMCGIGGSFTCVAKPADGPAVTVSALPRAPMHLPPDLWAERVVSRNPAGGGYLVEDFDNQVGYRSVCTPGAVAGLWEIHQRHGRLSWATTLEPAIGLSEGFEVPAETRAIWAEGEAPQPGYVAMPDKLGWTPASRAVYLKPDGSLYDVGERLVCHDYGTTLRRIADGGADEFYSGSIAEQIDADFRANDGYLCAEDLDRYAAQTGDPVAGSYRGLDLVTSQPPMSGMQLVQMLHILEHFDLSAMDPFSPDYIDLIARVQQACFVDRGRYLGDPEFTDVPVDWLTSPERCAAIADRIGAGHRVLADDPALVARNTDSPDTTHVSTWDRDGNAVSLTHSLGNSSGVVTPGLGFTFNNMMHIFNPYPGHPNSIAPFKRRTGGATPTIVLRDGNPVIVVGAPGGTRIPTAVVATLLGVIDHGMSPAEAVAVPRWHSEGDALHVESGIYWTMRKELARRGWHDIRGSQWTLDRFYARPQCIEITDDGRLRAGSDPRGGGCIGRYP